jgi:hypothetical protein
MPSTIETGKCLIAQIEDQVSPAGTKELAENFPIRRFIEADNECFP